MSDSASWYQRKFGNARQPGAGQRQQQPPVAMPRQPITTQNANATYTTATSTSGYMQFQPQQPMIDPRTEKVTIGNLWDKMQHWRGGPAHRIDKDPCPNCGSPNFSGRTNGIMRGPPPAPHCFNCGYNGMFEQGLASSWQPS